jgi:alkyl sulfatase BDS1-like metallo-beta-lactamase superfamily hydrolase
LLADAFEQIGYQRESPSVRNSFLAAALELRSGIPEESTPTSTSPDVVRAVSTAQFLDLLGIRLDPQRAEEASFTINLVTPDNGERFVVELSNGTLTSLEGFLADDADLTVTINRSDLVEAMTGAKPLASQIADGTARVDGDAGILATLAGMLVHFSPTFAIMPGTSQPGVPVDLDPFVQEPPGDSSGG